MPKNYHVERERFDIWADDKEIEYAACSISRDKDSNILHRLRFLVIINGGYKVTLGSDILYEGASFHEAASTYNIVKH